MFTVLFEACNRVMLVRYSGLLSPEDLAAVDDFVTGFVAREGYVRSIYDFTVVDTFAIPHSRLRERGRKLRMNPGQDRVFVAPQREIHALYQDYAQGQLDIGNGGLLVVRALHEALDVLQLHKPNFEPIFIGTPSL